MSFNRSFATAAALAVATTFASLQGAAAVTVAEGHELLAVPGPWVIGSSRIPGDPWIGDPDNIGEGLCARPRHYDFGDGNGCVYTGDASIIVKRRFLQQDADEAADVHRLTILAMSLVTTSPVPGVPPLGNYSLRFLRGPGDIEPTVQIGSQINNFDPDGGIEANFMRIYDDPSRETQWGLSAIVRITDLVTGSVFEYSGEGAEPTAFNTGESGLPMLAWSRTPPEGAVEIEGINAFLNGTDRSEDIWRSVDVGRFGSGNFRPAVVPLPPMVPALALVLLGGLACGARRHRAGSGRAAAG